MKGIQGLKAELERGEISFEDYKANKAMMEEELLQAQTSRTTTSEMMNVSTVIPHRLLHLLLEDLTSPQIHKIRARTPRTLNLSRMR